MIEDDPLERRLHAWTRDGRTDDPLDPGDLASRVRMLRSARTNRSRGIAIVFVVVSGAVFVGLSTSQVGVNPAFDSAQKMASTFGAPDAADDEPDQVLNWSIGDLPERIEQLRQKTELLELRLRIYRLMSDTDRLSRDCDRWTRREQIASRWLVATFREMASAERP